MVIAGCAPTSARLAQIALITQEHHLEWVRCDHDTVVIIICIVIIIFVIAADIIIIIYFAAEVIIIISIFIVDMWMMMPVEAWILLLTVLLVEAVDSSWG